MPSNPIQVPALPSWSHPLEGRSAKDFGNFWAIQVARTQTDEQLQLYLFLGILEGSAHPLASTGNPPRDDLPAILSHRSSGAAVD